MTYSEMYSMFIRKFKTMKPDDYRPVMNGDIPTTPGITIWMKNGDIIVYYPKIKEDT